MAFVWLVQCLSQCRGGRRVNINNKQNILQCDEGSVGEGTIEHSK